MFKKSLLYCLCACSMISICNAQPKAENNDSAPKFLADGALTTALGASLQTSEVRGDNKDDNAYAFFTNGMLDIGCSGTSKEGITFGFKIGVNGDIQSGVGSALAAKEAYIFLESDFFKVELGSSSRIFIVNSMDAGFSDVMTGFGGIEGSFWSKLIKTSAGCPTNGTFLLSSAISANGIAVSNKPKNLGGFKLAACFIPNTFHKGNLSKNDLSNGPKVTGLDVGSAGGKQYDGSALADAKDPMFKDNDKFKYKAQLSDVAQHSFGSFDKNLFAFLVGYEKDFASGLGVDLSASGVFGQAMPIDKKKYAPIEIDLQGTKIQVDQSINRTFSFQVGGTVDYMNFSLGATYTDNRNRVPKKFGDDFSAPKAISGGIGYTFEQFSICGGGHYEWVKFGKDQKATTKCFTVGVGYKLTKGLTFLAEYDKFLFKTCGAAVDIANATPGASTLAKDTSPDVFLVGVKVSL